MEVLEKNLNEFCRVCDADEVVLFEKATFLVISHATHKSHRDMHRFEKISNIIKQFKLSCSKSMAQFQVCFSILYRLLLCVFPFGSPDFLKL